MKIDNLVQNFFLKNPECTFKVLGIGENNIYLDLQPYGINALYLNAMVEQQWVDRYHQANQTRFSGALTLPGWVLCDLFLVPAAIGIITCPAKYISPQWRPPDLKDDDEAIAAAFYAAPHLKPGTFVGVSLFSCREGIGVGAIVKAITLKMLKAKTQIGITQWSSHSLRIHTRLGNLKVLGPAPGHDLAKNSFVYSIALDDSTRPPSEGYWVGLDDTRVLNQIMTQVCRGESKIEILAPGLSSDGAKIYLRQEHISRNIS